MVGVLVGSTETVGVTLLLSLYSSDSEGVSEKETLNDTSWLKDEESDVVRLLDVDIDMDSDVEVEKDIVSVGDVVTLAVWGQLPSDREYDVVSSLEIVSDGRDTETCCVAEVLGE